MRYLRFPYVYSKARRSLSCGRATLPHQEMLLTTNRSPAEYRGLYARLIDQMKAARFVLFLLVGLLALPASAAPERSGQILFSSNRSGAWRIWQMNADGSALKQVTTQEGDEQDVDPMFSADGKAILFTSTRGGKVGVWRMGVDGSKAERICDGDQAEWSPDNKKVALRRNERIVIRELGSGTEKTLSPEDWPHCSGPAWSPDGQSLAFAARWEVGNGVFIVRPEGGKPVKVYDQQGACEPHWAPDGKRLVYETETHICTINPDGTKNRVITSFGGVQRYARYSPDGKLLVFCQGASEQGPWELYIVPAAGGAPAKLTEGGSDMYPDWK
jgi:Tol biopolymer transport system component